MSWVNNVPGSSIRQNLQSLVFNLAALHQQFCKQKNSANFIMVADLCDNLIEQIEANTPPSAELAANLVNSLNTQVRVITQKKEGHQNQQAFDKLLAEISQQITKIGGAFQDGIRKFEQTTAELTISISSTSQLRRALVDTLPKETLLAEIDRLREIPQNSSCASLINRAFFKHRVATIGGLSSIILAGGGMLQSGLNTALHMLNVGINACSEPLDSIADSRVVVPGTMLLAGTFLFSYALCASRAKPLIVPPRKNSPDEEQKIENHQSPDNNTGQTPLLLSPLSLKN